MKCPECHSEIEIMVNATLIIPSELIRRLSKTNFKKKGVKIYSVYWDKASYFCKNKICGWYDISKE